MLITVFVFSLSLAPWAFIQAVEDPIAAANVFKYGEGTIAPRFIIEDLEGNRVRLKDFRGKVVLITFWTTW
jgi:cytochrome oxidase Cu insertion factor (SCO1/SenC/PrrC family)